MEYIYPVFKQKRIMKAEAMTELRDYSYAGLFTAYQDYSDGIIKGCNLTTGDGRIIVGEGCIKCGDYIFLIKKPAGIAYHPTEEYVSLKFCIMQKEEYPDYILYDVDFLLDSLLQLKENETEICRFKLKRGAGLRHVYKDFYDIQTEFDTLNLADATWAGRGEPTLSKAVTDFFAREVLQCRHAEWQDVQFAYTCLKDDTTVPRELLCDYIMRKNGDEPGLSYRNQEMFEALTGILEDIRGGRNTHYRGENRISRMIIMD